MLLDAHALGNLLLLCITRTVRRQLCSMPLPGLMPRQPRRRLPPAARRCGERAAEYTCPRCNARYCSLDCYKQHSDRCTEGFYRCGGGRRLATPPASGLACSWLALRRELPNPSDPTSCPTHPTPPRDAAVSELQGMRAGEDERRHMLDILQRLHQQEVEGGGGSSEDEEGGGSEAGDEGGLSEETLHRLIAKVRGWPSAAPSPAVVPRWLSCGVCRQQSTDPPQLASPTTQMAASGGALDIGAEDLSPAELAAFHRALAAGELSGAVQPWDPWWLSEDAACLELSAAGTSLVAAAVDADHHHHHQQQQPSTAGSGSGSAAMPQAAAAPASSSALPPPPSRPLPPLAALTRAAPSPLLRHQLLELVYAYCHTLRLFNGDYTWEAADAADALFALSPVLAAAAAAATTPAPGGHAASSSGGSEAAAVAPTLLACVQRACQPPVGSRDSRAFAVGVLSDVAAVLRLGRPVVLTALMDTSRLVEAARQQLEGGGGGGDGGQAAGRTKQVRCGVGWAYGRAPAEPGCRAYGRGAGICRTPSARPCSPARRSRRRCGDAWWPPSASCSSSCPGPTTSRPRCTTRWPWRRQPSTRSTLRRWVLGLRWARPRQPWRRSRRPASRQC